jgi:hypothetical protein
MAHNFTANTQRAGTCAMFQLLYVKGKKLRDPQLPDECMMNACMQGWDATSLEGNACLWIACFMYSTAHHVYSTPPPTCG